MSDHEESIHAVWVEPTQYDPLKHGPPCLPDRRTASMKLAANVKQQVQAWVKQADVGPEMIETLKGLATEASASPLGYLSALLVYLRAAAMVHQSHHWQTSGQSSYGDHLLFERLYNDTLGGIDALAERAVGLGSPALVNPGVQAKHLSRVIDKCYEGTKIEEGPNGMVGISLHVEFHVLVATKVVLSVLGQAGMLTDGTENLLQGIADKHEEFVYLLKQRSNVAPYSYAR